MSRNQLPSSSSRYKISSPQPYHAQPSPYPSDPSSSQPPYPPTQASSLRQNGSATPTPGGPGGSPARPARSRMRDAPQPATPTIPPSAAQRPAPQPRVEIARLQTQNLRRPSENSSGNGFELPLSPISPVSPNGAAAAQATSNGLFNDPFAADRSQRSELRAQTSAAAQQSQMPLRGATGGAGSDKLRNVVGAFMTAGKGREEPPARPRPGKSKMRPQQQQREEIWDVGPEGVGKFAEIDSVLRKIRRDWPFVMDSDFSPSTLALSLLSQTPSATLPQHPPLSSFIKLHEALSSALQSAVQAHFQSFAASLPAHASFLATLARAQQQVRSSKEALQEARNGFAGKGKSELAGIRARERQVRDMLRILDVIDHLKQIPDQLESLIGDKKFLQAALILVKSIKTINKPEFAEIGALSDLKAYFTSQETTLTDILVEELHSHLYLKTYYSDSRWRPYHPGQQFLPTIELSEDAESSSAGPGPSSRLSRYLTVLSTKPSQDPMLEYLDTDLSLPPDMVHRRNGSTSLGQAGSTMSLSSLAIGTSTTAPANPESESFGYMEMLLEALAALGRLGSALEIVVQRVPGEIHALVDATLDEVDERSDQRREEFDAAGPTSVLPSSDGGRRDSLFAPGETLRIAVSLDAVGPPRHAVVLRDLFWTLYSKLAAVLEGHRVVYEVARWISSRRDFKDNSSRSNAQLDIPVLEIWKPVGKEIQTLLHTYLSDDSQGSALDRHPLLSVNEILRDGKLARDRQKQIFKFADTDSRGVSNDIKVIDDSLQQALKASVPGLVNMQSADASTQQSVLTGPLADSDDRISARGKHRTLIPPNPFNVSTLFQPTLAFIERASITAPPGFEEEPRAFGSVLEDFVVNVFLPQLDEKVTASFQQAVSGYDAYQVDRKVGEEIDKPPLKSAVRVMALIHSLCFMLQTTPFHRENYSRLIVGVIVQYYQQCSSRFKELASLANTHNDAADPPMAAPAVWAQREDIIQVLTEMRAVVPNDRQELSLISQREIRLETDLLGNKPLVESQLINSQRKLEALGSLSQSLRWFIDSLLDLQTMAEEPPAPDGQESLEANLAAAPPLSAEPSEEAKLPLTRAMAQRYEAIIQTYEQLAEMVLNTIRLELRGRVVCNLGAALRKGDFRLETEALEPDPDVVDLNINLIESEEVVEKTLAAEDRSFVFRGLGQLVDHVFIFSARNIQVVNLAGVKKIKRNILALQQTLRGVSQSDDDGVLGRSMAYWDMYERGPKDMLESLRTAKPVFSFEDYNTMLNLQCKTDQADAPSSELNTYLIDLHALSMSIEGWEIGEG